MIYNIVNCGESQKHCLLNCFLLSPGSSYSANMHVDVKAFLFKAIASTSTGDQLTTKPRKCPTVNQSQGLFGSFCSFSFCLSTFTFFPFLLVYGRNGHLSSKDIHRNRITTVDFHIETDIPACETFHKHTSKIHLVTMVHHNCSF